MNIAYNAILAAAAICAVSSSANSAVIYATIDHPQIFTEGEVGQVPNVYTGVSVSGVLPSYNLHYTDELIIDIKVDKPVYFRVSPSWFSAEGIDYEAKLPGKAWIDFGTDSYVEGNVVELCGIDFVQITDFVVERFLRGGGYIDKVAFDSLTVDVGGYVDAWTGVPEPTTWALFVGGIALLGALIRRKSKTFASTRA